MEPIAVSLGLAMMAFVLALTFICGTPSPAVGKAAPSIFVKKSPKLPVVTEAQKESLRQNFEIARRNSELLQNQAASNIYLPAPRPVLDKDLVTREVADTRFAINESRRIVGGSTVSSTSDRANKAAWKELCSLIEQGSYKLRIIEMSVESVTEPSTQQEYQDASMEAFAWDAAQLKEMQEKQRKLLDTIE